MSEGEPLRCPSATVKGPTTLSSSQAGLPGSSGHVSRAEPLPAGPPSCSPRSSIHSPSPAPSASHPLGPRGPSLALDVISWALRETQGEITTWGSQPPTQVPGASFQPAPTLLHTQHPSPDHLVSLSFPGKVPTG